MGLMGIELASGPSNESFSEAAYRFAGVAGATVDF